MATAKKDRVGATPDRAGRRGSDTPLEFHVYRTNGGRYTWEIVDERGVSLAHSPPLASQSDAEHAARCVFEGAASARLAFGAPERREAAAV